MKKFENFTKDDKLVGFYEARQKWELDRKSEVGHAERKGLEQGIEKTAIKMLQENAEIPFISRITGISENRLMELKKNL